MSGTSIRQLATAAGVSVATVSRIFNRHHCVRPEVRDRVLAMAKELHYAPAVTTSHYRFGVIIGSTASLHFGSYGGQLLEGIMGHLSENQIQANILFGNEMEYLHKHSYQALIVICSDFNEEIASCGIKAVTINHQIAGLPMVATDHAGGLIQALDHLISHGHSQIAYLHSTQADWGNEQRLAGYRLGIGRHALPFRQELLAQFTTRGDISAALASVLPAHPTAVIVEGEDFGLAAFHAIRHQGLRIPEDLSVITFEDPEVSPYLYPGSTTISQDLCQLGKIAAETAINLVSDHTSQNIPSCNLLGNRLIERHSVCSI